MLNEVIYLITEVEKTHDEDGFKQEPEQIKTRCFASLKNTSYREYFQALREDEIVTDIFTVDERDYNLSMIKDEKGKKIKPNLIEYDGTLYRIVRRYRRSATSGNRTIELTCKEVE